MREAGIEYVAALAVPCRDGVLGIEVAGAQPERTGSSVLAPDAVLDYLPACLRAVRTEVDCRGGIQPFPS